MLIAESVVVAGSDPGGRDLLGQWGEIGVAGALLADLVVRGHLDLDDKLRVVVRDASAPTDPTLAAALTDLAGAEGRRARFVLQGAGRRLTPLVRESLSRDEVLQPEDVRLLGLKVGTHWTPITPEVSDGVRRHLVATLLGTQPADADSVAAVGVLHALNVLAKVLPRDLRPATTDKDLRESARGLLRGGWGDADLEAQVLACTRATVLTVQGARGNPGRL